MYTSKLGNAYKTHPSLQIQAFYLLVSVSTVLKNYTVRAFVVVTVGGKVHVSKL